MVRDIELSINGDIRRLRADDAASLLDVLRGEIGLKAARFGCNAGQCGACSVLIDGEDLASCQLEVGNIEGKAIVTLEGIGTPDRPHRHCQPKLSRAVRPGAIGPGSWPGRPTHFAISTARPR